MDKLDRLNEQILKNNSGFIQEIADEKALSEMTEHFKTIVWNDTSVPFSEAWQRYKKEHNI